MRPSFIGGMINGLLMVVVIVMTVMYWTQLSDYQRIIIMALLGLLIGVHALLHHIEEIYYHFNPLERKSA